MTAAFGPLGAGFTPLPQAKGGSDYSSCGYQKGRDTAAVTILGAPRGNGVEANTGREERQRAAGHAITPLPGLCDRAFLANVGPTGSIEGRLAGRRAGHDRRQVEPRGGTEARSRRLRPAALSRRGPLNA